MVKAFFFFFFNVLIESHMTEWIGSVDLIMYTHSPYNMVTTYSRVHISSDTAFLKILKKPSIVQE